MTETNPHHPAFATESAESATRSWDSAAIAGILGVPAEPRIDHVRGEGLRYRIGDPPTTELDIFPAARSVTITTETFAVSLVRQDPPVLSPEAVVFTSSPDPETHWLSISPQGATTLVYEPRAAGHERAAEPSVSERHPITLEVSNQSRSDDTVPSHVASEDAIDGAIDGDTKDRLRVSGRLGTEIRFRTTRTGKLVASFPLAITQDDGSTQWRDVLVFDQRAEKLRSGELPRKGQYCEIIGYRHEREVKAKDGTVRRIEELYAVVIKPR